MTAACHFYVPSTEDNVSPDVGPQANIGGALDRTTIRTAPKRAFDAVKSRAAPGTDHQRHHVAYSPVPKPSAIRGSIQRHSCCLKLADTRKH
jgi:hypothetical protein